MANDSVNQNDSPVVQQPFAEHHCVDKWRGWLSHLRLNLHELLGKRDFQRHLHEHMRVYRPKSANRQYVSWLWLTNSESLLLGLRRLTDRDDRAISLRNLMKEVEENWSLLSRERHIERLRSRYLPHIPDTQLKIANHEYDQWKNPYNPGHIDPAAVNADLIRLWDSVEVANMFVNQAIAHYQDPGTRSKLTLKIDDVLASVEVAWSLLRKYNTMIDGSDPSSWYEKQAWMQIAVADLFEKTPKTDITKSES